MDSSLAEEAGRDPGTEHLENAQVHAGGPSTELLKPPQRLHRPGAEHLRQSYMGSEVILFACPFFKLSPVDSHQCMSLGFERPADVVHHISRNHVLDKYCAFCYAEFGSESDFNGHLRAGRCTRARRPPAHRLTPCALSDLIRSHGGTPEDRWYIFWDIISHGQRRPDSPYAFGGFRDGNGGISLLQPNTTTPSSLDRKNPEPLGIGAKSALRKESLDQLAMIVAMTVGMTHFPPLPPAPLMSMQALAQAQANQTQQERPDVASLAYPFDQISPQQIQAVRASSEMLAGLPDKQIKSLILQVVHKTRQMKLQTAGDHRSLMSPEVATQRPRDDETNTNPPGADTEGTKDLPPQDSGHVSSYAHPCANEGLEGATKEIQALVIDQWREEEKDGRTMHSMADDAVEAELSEAILRSIRHLNCQPSQIDHIVSVLPTLLRSFAHRLRSEGLTRAAKDAMYLVCKHIGDIATRLQSAANNSHEEEDEDQSSPEPSSKQNIEKWRQEVQNVGTLLPTEAKDEEPEVESGDSALPQAPAREFGESSSSLPDKPGFRDFVFESASFRWLLEALTKTVMLTFEGENFCATLQSMVTNVLARHESASNKQGPDCYTMEFQADWNPTIFLNEQFPDNGDIGRLLEEVLTLTGSMTNAQMLPCSEYLRQTWPSTGLTLLELLKTAVVTGTAVSGLLEDDTQLEILFGRSRVSVKVDGTAASIAEIGEQIAWLGAALRSSCVESGIATCTPQIRMDDTDGRKSCHISFRMKPYREPDLGLSNGQCWHELCQNPVLVEGYPIAARSPGALGLEIPLNVLSGLTACPRVNKFFGRYYLKGFSTAAMAMRNLGTEMLWHFYHSPDDSRLPYPTPDSETEEEETQIDLNLLTHARHIVGWCSKARFYAGAPGMNYNIKPTKLKPPSKDFSLEKLSVSVGGIVTAGCQFAIGRKDSHVRITRISYHTKLSWIHRKYVTLWDVDEKRGWLVNGTAALLHLLRASLHFYRTGEVQCGFLLDEDQPKDSSSPLTLKSSLDVLQDQSNLRLGLFPPDEKTRNKTRLYQETGRVEAIVETISTQTVLKDRVEELYETLEMLIDHQASAETSYKGINAKFRFRDHLEGWDFADIATDMHPFILKQTTVPAQMKSWVDFTRSIPAITLFGRGYGDIIRATPASIGSLGTPTIHTCNTWETVPKNRHLLCVSAADLCRILARTPDESTGPIALGDGIFWHNPHDEDPFYSTCSCASRQQNKRNHHPVQEVRSSFQRSMMPKSTIDLEAHPSGAILFGEKESWVTALATLTSDTTSQSTMLGHSSTSAQSDGGDASPDVLVGSSTQPSIGASASGQHSDEQLAELAAMTVSQPDEEEGLAQGMSEKARGKRKASPLMDERGAKRQSFSRMVESFGKTLRGTGSRDRGSDREGRKS